MRTQPAVYIATAASAVWNLLLRPTDTTDGRPKVTLFILQKLPFYNTYFYDDCPNALDDDRGGDDLCFYLFDYYYCYFNFFPCYITIVILFIEIITLMVGVQVCVYCNTYKTCHLFVLYFVDRIEIILRTKRV